MIPFIAAPPSHPAPAGRDTAGIEKRAAGGTATGKTDTAATGGPTSGAEAMTFPAVLLALATIGSPADAPVDAAPEPHGTAPRVADAAGSSGSDAAVDAIVENWMHVGGDAEKRTLANRDESVTAWIDFTAKSSPGDGESAPDGWTESKTLVAASEILTPEEGALVHLVGDYVNRVAGVDSETLAELTKRATTSAATETLEGVALPASDASAQSQQVPDTVTLDPGMLRSMSRTFVAKLNRVADRMWAEHGLRLEVVEGYRSAERQQQLFAQGRSAPGPVVTWTRNSLHTEGAAADVFVNGAPVGPEEAIILARVAREEGLTTLYPFDSGHVQLEGFGRGAGPEGPLNRPSRPAPPSVRTPPPGVAPVAPTAPVARPARPGGLVSVEPEGIESSLDPVASSRPPEVLRQAANDPSGRASGEPAGLAAGRAALAINADAKAIASSGRGVSGVLQLEDGAVDPDGSRHAKARASADGTVDVMAARGGSPPPSEHGGAPAPPGTVRGGSRAVDAAGPASGASGVSAPSEAQVAAYRNVRVPIEGVGGASLHLGISPGAVSARLDIADPTLAQRLEGRLHELRQALADRGFESRGLSVRAVAMVGAPEGTSEALLRPAATAGGERATTGDSATDPHRERGPRLGNDPENPKNNDRSRRDRGRERND